MVRSCALLALLVLPALGSRYDEVGFAVKRGPRWRTCQKIQNFKQIDVEHCEELLASMQRLLSSLDCDALKSALTKEMSNLQKSIAKRGVKEAVGAVLGGADLELIDSGLHVAEAAVEVARPHGETAFEYHHEGAVQTLSQVTALSTVAIFTVGLAVDIFLLGATGMATTIAAAELIGLINMANGAVGWTHDVGTKIPYFRKFSRLVTTKCSFVETMKDTHKRLLNVGSDDVPWPEPEEEEGEAWESAWTDRNMKEVHERLQKVGKDQEVPWPNDFEE